MFTNGKKFELKDEDLEIVDGGTLAETLQDYKDLKNLGLLADCNSFSPNGVKQAFNSFNIRYDNHGGTINNNHYYLGDKEISRDEAYQIIRNSLENK